MRLVSPLSTLFLSCALLQADGLSDLKSALKGLPNPAPTVRLRIEEKSQEQEPKERDEKEGKGRMEQRIALVEDGPEGTRILEDSRPARTPEQGKHPGTTRKDSSEFRQALCPAEELLEQLETARSLEEKVETYPGRPARRLKLALEIQMDAEARRHVKKADHVATFWIDTDGFPLAVNHQIDVKARVLLFASVWSKIEITRRFQRAQGRLLLLDEQANVQGAALGKSFSSRESTLCTLVQ